MRLQCFMPVRDEVDILPWVIHAMRRQDCDIHVLDGWSTDGSWELLPHHHVTRERFPPAKDTGLQNCEDILRRIEHLAWQSTADWCLLSDADEIRTSADPHETLLERIARIDQQGFNVADFRVVSFQMLDDSYLGDPELHFRYYTEDESFDGVLRPAQEKAWKNDVAVDLHSSGGHVIYRPHKRVYPEKLLMKHYPWRTNEQARRKLTTRLTRRNQSEHDRGFGVHYDHLDPKENFIRDRAVLKLWEGA